MCNDARGCLSLKHTFHALNLSVWTVRKRAHVPQSFDVENLKFLGHGQISEISNTVIEDCDCSVSTSQIDVLKGVLNGESIPHCTESGEGY